MKQFIKNTMAIIVLLSTAYSCTMANRNVTYSRLENYDEPKDLPVIMTEDLFAIGDTFIFKNGYPSEFSDLIEFDQNGRKVIYRDHMKLATVIQQAESGKMFIKTCIDRNGDVKYAEIDQKNTTITNKRILSNALNMIMSYKFEPDSSAPEHQCGVIKLFLDINAK